VEVCGGVGLANCGDSASGFGVRARAEVDFCAAGSKVERGLVAAGCVSESMDTGRSVYIPAVLPVTKHTRPERSGRESAVKVMLKSQG
jgi:hypothetical protein